MDKIGRRERREEGTGRGILDGICGMGKDGRRGKIGQDQQDSQDERKGGESEDCGFSEPRRQEDTIERGIPGTS